MATEPQKISFIGLGRMGTGIAQNICKAGYRVTVYNRNPAKMQPLIEKGAVGAKSPREAAWGADAVITCLMDDKSVIDSVIGGDGMLAGLAPGAIHICATTISPQGAVELARLHAEHGSHYVAGPVVGRPDMAAAGTLLTYVAGDQEIVKRCDRLLRSYAAEVFYLGADHKRANRFKLALNYFIIAVVELMGEMYAFGEKGDIPREEMYTVIERMLTRPGLKNYAKKILARDFDDAGFELISGFKDVTYMLRASTELRAPLNYASVLRDKFLTALAHGMEHKDWSAITEISRMNAGLD